MSGETMPEGVAGDRAARALMSPGDTVAEALRRMDETGNRIVFVTAPDRALLGVATDGDLRRWILSGRSLDEPVEAAMNPRPLTVAPGYDRADVERLMVDRRIDCVPIVGDGGRVTGAVWWVDLFAEAGPKPSRPIQLPVVVMAGGRGSRLGAYTRVLPKPLVPLGDKPVIELIMDRLHEAGCREFHVTLNYKAGLIRAYFADVALPYEVDFVEEPRALGTGGSLALLREELDQTFILTNCDILVDADYADIVDLHRESGNLITLVASLKHYTVPYGVCDVGEGGSLTAMREKPHFDFLVSTGLYVMEPEVLADVPDDTFLHVTDIVNRYLAEGRKVGVYPVSEKAWTDVGQLDELHSSVERLEEGS